MTTAIKAGKEKINTSNEKVTIIMGNEMANIM